MHTSLVVLFTRILLRQQRRIAMFQALSLALIARGPGSPIVSAAPLPAVDLSTYVLVGRFDLPEPTRSAAPAGSLLAAPAA